MKEQPNETPNENVDEEVDESLLTGEQKEEFGKKMPIVPFAIVFGIFVIAIVALVIVILNLPK